MGQILMNSFHVLLALLFIVSPVCVGIFAAIGYMRKKELKKLHKTLEELRAENQALLNSFAAEQQAGKPSERPAASGNRYRRKKRRSKFRNRQEDAGNNGDGQTDNNG